MGKYKVFIGLCGPEVITSNVINAADKKSALKKYYDSIGEEYDDAKLEADLKRVYEYVSEKKA